MKIMIEMEKGDNETPLQLAGNVQGILADVFRDKAVYNSNNILCMEQRKVVVVSIDSEEVKGEALEGYAEYLEKDDWIAAWKKKVKG